MEGVDIDRSVHFVSLDTHPANNALVVTYEIQVVAKERASQHELLRRNKRAQHQINISVLDRSDLKLENLALNLQELSSDILLKCPLLSSGCNNLEDIQLHLLYLINRRRTQLQSISTDRPQTSTSLNRNPQEARKLSASRHSARPRRSSGLLQNIDHSDVYCNFVASEPHSNCCDEYLDRLDEHLNGVEFARVERDESLAPRVAINELDTHLEGLYGDNKERFESITIVRRLIKSDENLVAMSGNKLLICALIRTMRDSEAKDIELSESIFYCLLRFTSFDDVFRRTSLNENPVELPKIVLNLLTDYIKHLIGASPIEQQTKMEQSYHYICSLLMILRNLLDLNMDLDVYKSMLSEQQDKQSLSALIEMLQLASKHLSRQIRLLNRPENILNILKNLVELLQDLSLFKEFIIHLRTQQKFVDSILSLVNTCQLSRPGSGVKSGDTVLVSDKQTLNELYLLEIKFLTLISNLICDRKLKVKFIKKSLLKCVLRNLVVFLASRNSNSLRPFNRSPVLHIPFKIVYELSCNNEVKVELFKSRIVMKCLLEYLLSTTIDYKTDLTFKKSHIEVDTDNTKNIDNIEQFILLPKQSVHYVLCLMINLSSKAEATIYQADESSIELRELLYEFIDLCLANITLFLDISEAIATRQIDENYLTLYLHVKLLRTLSQFMQFRCTGESVYSNWVQRLMEISSELLLVRDFLLPITVECLASLSNLLSRNCQLSRSTLKDPGIKATLLLERLFLSGTLDMESENDDLLLVAIQFLGCVARDMELCEGDKEKTCLIFERIVRASSFILSSKKSDEAMTSSGLKTFIELMRHSSFLQELLNLNETSLGKIVENLTDLSANNGSFVSSLTIISLNNLRQLEEQNSIESSVYTKRFATYNAKWLSAIRVSREELAEGGELNDADFGDEEEEEDAIGGSTRFKVFGEERSENSQRSFGSLDETKEDSNDLEEDAESLDEAPDLNVIDANSMIKHLTKRRDLRTEWLKR